MRRLLSGILVLAAGGVAVTSCGGSGSATAAAVTAPPGATRFAADDDATTAALVSSATTPSASDPILVRPDSIVDGLAATYLAGNHVSSVLFTGQDEVPEATLAELRRLGAYHVRVLGGTSVVSEAVVHQLEHAGMKQVDRVAGADRYATAAAGAENVGAANVGVYRDKGHTVLLASGELPWDALAAGPISYGQQWPILLSTRDRLPDATAAVLGRLGVQHVVVVGGEASIAPEVVGQLEAIGLTVERIAGDDRSATAVALTSVFASLGFVPTRPVVVGANAAADAIVAAELARPHSPILLCVSASDCGAATLDWLRGQAAAVEQVLVVGTQRQVSDTAKAALDAAAG